MTAPQDCSQCPLMEMDFTTSGFTGLLPVLILLDLEYDRMENSYVTLVEIAVADPGFPVGAAWTS